MSRTFRTEFERVYWIGPALEAALAENGFADASWHNEVCPRFERRSPLNRRRLIVVWCNTKSRAARELGGERYVICEEDADGYGVPETTTTLFTCERTADAVALVNDHGWGLDPATEKPVFERMKNEIVADILDGIIPAAVNTYAELHDYCDANEYGGAFEEDDECPCPYAGKDWDKVVEFYDRLQNACDSWLRAGGHRRRLGMPPAPLPAEEPAGEKPAALPARPARRAVNVTVTVEGGVVQDVEVTDAAGNPVEVVLTVKDNDEEGK